MRMVILAPFTRIGSEKAKSVTKIDMVKPIPPRILAPINCIQDVCDGFCANPNRMENQENKKIPIGFPTTKPSKMP